jgi:RHS repeat-associated protein
MGIAGFYRRLVLVTFVIAICGAPPTAFSQSYPYNVEMLPRRGAMPTADRIASDVDAIEVTTGNLSVEIPLAPLPAGRAESSFSLKLIYDSGFYEMAPGTSENGTVQYLVTPAAPGGRASGTPGGWSYNYQTVGPRTAERYVTAGDCQTNIEQRRRYISWFVLPDGSPHILHLSGYGDERNDSYSGDGFYELSMTGHQACAGPTTGTLTYFTVDGSFLKFEIQANGAGGLGPLSGQTWTLHYPDGRRITGDGFTATAFHDASGNRFRVENHYEGWLPYTVIRDDFDRLVRLDFDVTGAPAGRKRDRVTGISPVGPVSWTVDWETLVLDGDNAAPRYYVCRESDQVTCRLGVSTANGYIGRELTVVRYIQLPEAPASDDPPDWNSWAFRYAGDAEGGFGELNHLRTPDGARYDYTYRFQGTVPSSAQLLHANGVATKRITHDGITDLVWALNYAAVSDSDFRTTVTQPDGAQTVYHYANPTNLTRWDRGLVYRIDAPLGSVRKREWARNLTYSLRGSHNTAAQNNPYIRKETVTVGNAAGTPARTGVVEFAVDKNGNLLGRKEYDWVAYSPSGMETGGSLLRQSSNLYYVETPDASEPMDAAAAYANAYWDAHGTRECGEPGQQHTVPLARLDAVRRQTVSDAATIKAASEFGYDCAFTSGNLTSEARWDSSKSTAVPPLAGMTAANAVILRRGYSPSGDLLDVAAPDIASEFIYEGGGTGPYVYRARLGSGDDLRSQRYQYNVPAGVRTSALDEQSGFGTTYTYDLYGRVRTVTEAGRRSTETIYNSANRAVMVKQDRETLGDGQLQKVTHRDQLGRVVLVRATDGPGLSETGASDGIKTSTIYIMAAGGARLVNSTPYRQLSDSTLEWRCVQSDALGRATAVAMFTGQSAPVDCNASANRTGITITTYDADRIRIVDPAGKTRDEYRDALGRLIEVREDPNGLNYVTRYEYNVLDDLTHVVQADGAVTQTRNFAYSSLGRLLSATNPETGTISYQYDDGGNLIRREDARSVVTYCYDSLHRLEGKRYGDVCTGPDTFDVYYTYYANDADTLNRGRLESVSSWQATNVFADYDDFGRPQTNTQRIQTPEGQWTEFTLHYAYRIDGSVSTLTYPSGKAVFYEADHAGRTIRAHNGVTVYADMTAGGIDRPFTADGRVRQMKLGNGLWETRDYRTPDATTLLQLGTQPNASELLQLEYTYEPTANNGNLSQHVIRRGSIAWAQFYTYDALNRLSNVSEAGAWARTYGYDRFGNRWVASSAGLTLPDVHEPGTGTVFNRQTNRLNNALYDAAGNQVQAPGHPLTLGYDAENRLVRAESVASGNAYFGYDGTGRRVWKSWTPNGGQPKITYYVYGLKGEVLAEYTNQAPSPLASGRTYVFADMLGSVRAITSDQGPAGPPTVVECYDYLPFGRVLGQNDHGRHLAGCHPANPDFVLESADAQKFTGHQRDTELRLDYFGARYYSPGQGRFVSPDEPFVDQHPGDPQSWNLYGYVRNNPMQYVDPGGRDCVRAIAVAPSAGDALKRCGDFAVGSAGAVANSVYGLFNLPNRLLNAALSPVTDFRFGDIAPTIEPQNAEQMEGMGRTNLFLLASPVIGNMPKIPNFPKIPGIPISGKIAADVTTNSAGVISWNPLNGPGPLGINVALTFRSATYVERVTIEPMILYRSYGGRSPMIGPFWTATPPAGPLQSIIDMALNPAWGNNASKVVKIRVPVGTRIFEGATAPQGELLGGGSQVFIQKVDPSWIIK